MLPPATVGGISRSKMPAPSAGRRAFWNILDQATASTANFVLLIVIIRNFEASQVGVFTIAYATYFILLTVARGLVTDPLLIRLRTSTDGTAARLETTRAAIGATLGVATIFGVLLQSFWLLDTPWSTSLATVGIVSVPLVWFDAVRLGLIADHRPKHALQVDLIYLVLQTTALTATIASDTEALEPYMYAWGASGLVACAFSALIFRLYPSKGGRAWVSSNRDLGPAFGVDYLLNRLAEQGANVAVSSIATFSDLGAITSSRTLFAPATTLQTGINSFLVPELAATVARREETRARFLVYVSMACVVSIMIAIGVAIWLVPPSVGEQVVGSNWGQVHELTLPMTVFSIANAISFTLWAAAKPLARARRIAAARGVGGLALVGFSAIGARYGGGTGALWGMTLSASLTSALLGITLIRAWRVRYS